MMTARSTPTGRRLGLLLLGYLGVVVAVIVFAPFNLGPPSSGRVLLVPGAGDRIGDMVLNLALFVPVGFLLDRITGGRAGPWRIVAIGIAASLVIETAQLFMLDRYSTATDVLANGLGALVGGLASRGIRRRLGTSGSLTGRLFLDLPLLGLCWLLLPVLWVEALQGTWGPLLSVAVAGGFAIAGAGRSNAARERQPGGVLWPMVLGWSFLGALPALSQRPLTVLLAMITATLAFAFGDLMWRTGSGSDRRVEPRAVVAILVSLVPWFVIKGWTDVLDPHLTRHLRNLIFEWLALGAGFTVLGYALSEWRGRAATPWPRSALLPMLVATVVALPVTHGRMRYLTVAVIVAAFGSLLFEVQRAHVVSRRLG